MYKSQFMFLAGIPILMLIITSSLSFSFAHDLMEAHFRGRYVSGLLIYTCSNKGTELEDELRSCGSGGSVPCRVKDVRRGLDLKELRPSPSNPHRLGAFTSAVLCPPASSLLQQVSGEGLLSEGVSWLVEADQHQVSGLSLSLSSDLILVTSSGLLDVHKVLPTSSHLLLDPILPGEPRPLHLICRSPDRAVISLITRHILENDTVLTLNELAERMYHPEESPDMRYGIPEFVAFAQAINFTYDVLKSTSWGTLSDNGTWTGMLGRIHRGEAILGVNPSSITGDRLSAFHIFPVIRRTRFFWAFLQPTTFGSPRALMMPLSSTTWISLLLLVLLSIVVLRAMMIYDPDHEVSSLSSVTMFLIGSVTQQGMENVSQMGAMRTAVLSVLGFSSLILPYYGAGVLKGIILPNTRTINSLEQLFDSSIRLGICDVVYLHNFQNNSQFFGPRDALTEKMYSLIAKEKKMFWPLELGVERISEGGFALFMADHDLYYELKGKISDSDICSLTTIDKVRPLSLAMVNKKDSPFKEIMAVKYVWMAETGLKSRGLDTWLDPPPECHWRQSAVSAGVKGLTLAYLILVSGLSAAVFFFIIETIVNTASSNTLVAMTF